MDISKTKALSLINQKIAEFEKLLRDATPTDVYDVNHYRVYRSAQLVIERLFGKGRVQQFRDHVELPVWNPYAHAYKILEEYRNHLARCVAVLEGYYEELDVFLAHEEDVDGSCSGLATFIAMSFDEEDAIVNQYVTGILNALGIEFETGERYSKGSIPQKVRNRISACDVFIVVFVRRHELKEGGYATPPWLVKELGHAQAEEKDIIAWVEREITDIAGLEADKEIIYFDRSDPAEMQSATLKFLEALKEHGLL